MTEDSVGDFPTGSSRPDLVPDLVADDRFARHRLAIALRRLAAVSVATATDVAGLQQAAEAAEALTRRLGERLLDDPWASQAPDGPSAGLAWMMPLNAVSGLLNPNAPPVQFEFVGGEVRGHGRLGLPYVGPPNTVHGGWVSAMLDDALGLACVFGGHPGFTASLTVNFRRPTPLHRELELVARLSEVDGRKGWARGTISVDGEVTADAVGLFVRPDRPTV